MQPNLIPHSFVAKNMRKRYHLRRKQRSWLQCVSDYQYIVMLVGAVFFVFLILYIKYQDKQSKQSKQSKQHEQNEQHELRNHTNHFVSPTMHSYWQTE